MTRRDYRTAANCPSGTIADRDTFTFDRASRMRTAVNGRYTNTVTYTYDPVGRKATEALTISARTYTTRQAYNARNELTTITYPNNTTSTRSYHPTGTLNQLGLDGSTVSTRSYDAGRRQTTEVLSNGITETRTYRNDNLLSAINYSNTSLGNMTYTWDANKNKTSESITGVMSGYGFTAAGTTYDFEDRLTGFSRAATSGPALLSQSWNLTTVGDWTSVTTNGTAQNRTHGPTHELLTAGGQNVATDVKGNITTLPANLRPAGATTAMNLTWDSDNKLRSADIDANGTADVNFQYDALGRRVARTGTGGSVVFVQMDQQTIADYPVGGAATTPTFRYVYASYIDEPVVRKGPISTSTVHFYHRNQQYSVTAMTTSTGAIAERYAYTAYGQPTILNASGTPLSPQTSTLNSRYSYTGREWDATLGLHHFRARWMSPIAGRFLGRDPIGFLGGALNIVEYCHSNPFVYVDPNGEQIRPLPSLPHQPYPYPTSPLPPRPNAQPTPDPCLAGPPLPPGACPYGAGDKYGADFAMYDRNKDTGECKCDPHIMLHKFFGGGGGGGGRCWARVEWPLSCVCKSMPNDPTSNCVRGCLACIYKRKGNIAPDQKEHAMCIDHCVPWWKRGSFYSELDVTIHCCAKAFGVIVGPGTGNEPGPVVSPGTSFDFDCDSCGAGPTRKINCNVTK